MATMTGQPPSSAMAAKGCPDSICAEGLSAITAAKSFAAGTWMMAKMSPWLVVSCALAACVMRRRSVRAAVVAGRMSSGGKYRLVGRPREACVESGSGAVQILDRSDGRNHLLQLRHCCSSFSSSINYSSETISAISSDTGK